MDIWFLWKTCNLIILFIVAHTGTSSKHISTPNYSNFRSDLTWLWNVEEYPNPQEAPRSCQRFHKSFLCDPDDILSSEEALQLDNLINNVKEETPCLCSSCNSTNSGVIVAVALMKYIFLNYNAPPSEEVKIFAENLRKRWKFGTCENDILILVSSRDGERHTDVGESVASFLSKEAINRIFLDTRNYFANGLYYQGLESMIQSYSDVIRTQKLNRSNAPIKESSLNMIIGLTVTFVILVALLAGGAFWWTKRKRARENNQSYSWETSNSLKRADISKVQGPYIAVKTSDYLAPGITEKQREGHLESLDEEEEMEFEQLSEEEKRRLEDLHEDEDVQLEIEDSSKLQQIKDDDHNGTNVEVKSEKEGEAYFMPRERSKTEWQPSTESDTGSLKNTNL